jgi:hypothetical protein
MISLRQSQYSAYSFPGSIYPNSDRNQSAKDFGRLDGLLAGIGEGDGELCGAGVELATVQVEKSTQGTLELQDESDGAVHEFCGTTVETRSCSPLTVQHFPPLQAVH